MYRFSAKPNCETENVLLIIALSLLNKLLTVFFIGIWQILVL